MKSKFIILIFFLITSNIFSQGKDPISAYSASLNYGKSVAVFGESVSVIPESKSAKDLWRENLKLIVTDYGIPGAGFSSLQGKSMQQQINEAVISDIYILWASTNDYTNRREVGSYIDYSEFDGYDENKLTTQAGGINYCIKKIYEINPKAIIYFFTSSKAFKDRGRYDPFYLEGMNKYVEMQKKYVNYMAYPF